MKAATEQPTTAPTLDPKTPYITGKITKFTEGSRAARYMIGFGAGKAKVQAHIFVKNSEGKILLEKDVDGKMVMGMFGGSADGITRGLAKEIAKDVSKKILKK